MSVLSHLPLPIYHLPFISHLSFLSFANEKWLNVKLLKIANCKLIIASVGGQV